MRLGAAGSLKVDKKRGGKSLSCCGGKKVGERKLANKLGEREKKTPSERDRHRWLRLVDEKERASKKSANLIR